MTFLFRQLALGLGNPTQRFIDCQASRIRSSGTFVAENVVFSAVFSVVIPAEPILPESSTETMTFGAGSLPPDPAGTVASVKGVAWTPNEVAVRPASQHAVHTLLRE
jgi:hypothetical protein